MRERNFASTAHVGSIVLAVTQLPQLLNDFLLTQELRCNGAGSAHAMRHQMCHLVSASYSSLRQHSMTSAANLR
jgi:hypothetical protein